MGGVFVNADRNCNGCITVDPAHYEIIMGKDIKVSLFQNFKTRIPQKTVNLFEWLKDPIHKQNIEYFRGLPMEDRKKVKEMLQCITASGVFSVRRLDGLIQHSGIICIDIDAKENPGITDFEYLRDQISNMSNVAYCSLSASGKGVFCLIPIKFPEKHKEHFNALKMDFLKYNIVIDISCSDVSRLRISSYDERSYTNPNAVVYTNLLRMEIPKKEVYLKQEKLDKRGNSRSFSDSKTKVFEIVALIEESNTDITGNYAQWFQIGCAIANEFGEDGRAVFHSVSMPYSKYSSVKTDAQFDRCIESKYSYSIGTFFYWAEYYGLN